MILFYLFDSLFLTIINQKTCWIC